MGGTGVCKDGMDREDLLSAAEESGTQQRPATISMIEY